VSLKASGSFAHVVLAIAVSCGGVGVSCHPEITPAEGERDDGKVTIATGDAVVPEPDAGAADQGEAGAASSDVSADDRANLVQNPSFDHDVSGWQPEYGTDASWASLDAASNTGSGALAVVDYRLSNSPELAMGGARQCIAGLAPTHDFAAMVFIPSRQGVGGAGVDLEYFASSDCTGMPAGPFTTLLVQVTDVWSPIRVRVATPARARSLAIRLVVQKPFRQSDFRALFDEVALRPQ
jgi:hypothetical protein